MTTDEVARRIEDLNRGSISVAGTVTLSTGTSTVHEHYGVSSGSVVLLSALDAGAAAATGVYVVPTKGSFTINHSAGAAPRTFRYVFFTPRR